MQRVALVVDGWNILKAADRVRRRINFGELPRVVTALNGKSREIVFQRFYVGPANGNEHLEDEIRTFNYEWVQCVTDNGNPKTTVDIVISNDILTWAHCHSVEIIALCSGDGDFADTIRRAQVLGLCVEVYGIKLGHHISGALEQIANRVLDLEALGVLQRGEGSLAIDSGVNASAAPCT